MERRWLGKPIEFRGHDARIYSAAFSLDGTRIVTALFGRDFYFIVQDQLQRGGRIPPGKEVGSCSCSKQDPRAASPLERAVVERLGYQTPREAHAAFERVYAEAA